MQFFPLHDARAEIVVNCGKFCPQDGSTLFAAQEGPLPTRAALVYAVIRLPF